MNKSEIEALEREAQAFEREAAQQMEEFRKQEAEAARAGKPRPIGEDRARAIALNEMLSKQEANAGNKGEIERLKFEIESARQMAAFRQQEGEAIQQRETDAADRELSEFEREAAKMMAAFRQQEAEAIRGEESRPTADEDARRKAIELDAMLSKQAARQKAAFQEQESSAAEREYERFERESARQMAAFRQQEIEAARVGKLRPPTSESYARKKAIALNAALSRQEANAAKRSEIAMFERESAKMMAAFLKQEAEAIKIGHGRSTGDGYSVVDGKRCRGYVRGPAIAFKFGAEYIAIQMSKLRR